MSVDESRQNSIKDEEKSSGGNKGMQRLSHFFGLSRISITVRGSSSSPVSGMIQFKNVCILFEFRLVGRFESKLQK